MTKLFLSLHVLAAILAVGPVAVAASMFPPFLRRAADAPGDPAALSALRTLHRICRVYAAVGLAVPVFGFATASSLGVLGDVWLTTSIVLTGGAAALLVFAVLPGQDQALASVTAAGAPPGGGEASPSRDATTTVSRLSTRLAMSTGVFNLLWAVVTVLMIVRPGSTTGG